MTNIKPNNAQKRALKALKKNNKDKALIVLPSGIGKTYLSAFVTKRVKGKILYIVHRNEILVQAKESFLEIHNLTNDDIGFFNADSKELKKRITFSTIQTLSRKKNLKRIRPTHFEYIILDEWHHVGAKTYKRVLNYFKPKKLLGMTATPYRLDGKDILKAVDNNISFSMDLYNGIQEKLLVPFNYKAFHDNIDYSGLFFNGHRYTERDLNKKLLINERDKLVIEKFKKNLKDKQTLGFCCSVKHIERCVRKFNEAGIRSIGIDYRTPPFERQKIIKAFKNNKYQVIFTKDIFNEGVDFPEVEGLLFLRPTYSKTIFLQQLGRGLRTKKGKKEVIVLDFIGNYVNAYKITEWLHEIIKKGETREGKPIYNWRLGKIYFEEKLIDLFEQQNQGTIPKEKLINEYRRVKTQLKRVPSFRQFEQISIYTKWAYTINWGSWNNFVKSQGDKVNQRRNKRYTNKELINEYKRLKRLLKEQPRAREWVTQSKYPSSSYVTNFGGWNKFLIKMQEPLKIDTSRYKWSKKKIILEYKKLKKKLKRTPTYYDMKPIITNKPIIRFFGNYTNLKKEMKDYQDRKEISFNKHKSKLLEIKKRTGKYAPLGDCRGWAIRRFGSVKKTILAMGINYNEYKRDQRGKRK